MNLRIFRDRKTRGRGRKGGTCRGRFSLIDRHSLNFSIPSHSLFLTHSFLPRWSADTTYMQALTQAPMHCRKTNSSLSSPSLQFRGMHTFINRKRRMRRTSCIGKTLKTHPSKNFLEAKPAVVAEHKAKTLFPPSFFPTDPWRVVVRSPIAHHQSITVVQYTGKERDNGGRKFLA